MIVLFQNFVIFTNWIGFKTAIRTLPMLACLKIESTNQDSADEKNIYCPDINVS